MKQDHTRQQIVSVEARQLVRQLIITLLIKTVGWLIVWVLHHDLF